MKKYAFLLLLLSLFSFTFAQNSVNDISLGFCNDGTGNLTDKYTVMLDPWSEKDLCIYVQNKSDEVVKITYTLPKWFISKWGNQICGNKNDFAQFFVDNPNREIILSWNSTATIKETLKAPVWMIWMYYWCLAYQVWTSEDNTAWWMFNMVIRKASYVNMFVGSEDSIKNLIQLVPVTGDFYSSNKNIGLSIDENGDTILHYVVKNVGTTAQSVEIEGKFYNFLWFEKTFDSPEKKLLPQEESEQTINLWIMPAYKWLFDVRLNITWTPIFDFDVSMFWDWIKKPISVKENSTIFVFSWIYLAVLLLLLIIIIKIILPRKKK